MLLESSCLNIWRNVWYEWKSWSLYHCCFLCLAGRRWGEFSIVLRLFSFTLEIPFFFFCLLLLRASSHWRLHADAAISSATLLLLCHKQEKSPAVLVLLLSFGQGCKYKAANCNVILNNGKDLPTYTYPDVYLTINVFAMKTRHLKAYLPFCSSYTDFCIADKRRRAQC